MTKDLAGFGEADQSAYLLDVPAKRRPGTRAADGFERVQWTVEDVEAMARAGFFDDGSRIELIEGELLPMPPKNDPHEIVSRMLVRRLNLSLDDDIFVGAGTSFRLNRINWFDPDISVFPASIPPSALRGPDALLVIEIADSSLRRDRQLKGPVYARSGVRDYWIIDAERRVIIVHRGPKPDGSWTDVHEAAEEESVHPLALPHIAVRLDDLLPA